MATLFQATGGVIGTMQPSTTWAAPNGLFPTADRNDSSAYTWTSSTSTVTLPSSGLADGYLFLWGFEFEDTSNGRHNPQGRMTQASGTGNFVSASTGGYNRDTSEDRSYVSGWSFVDGPSASATFQFQWRRDTDAPNASDGTVRSFIQVVPFYYSDIGLYTSTSTTATGGTTPTQITGFSGTDGTNITISSNQISVTGDNKRYLCLGSAYHQGVGNARTQRWFGFEIDGTFDHSAKGCMYYRNAANADGGESFIKLIETATATRTIELNQYRGDGVAAGQGGADVDGNTTGSNSAHSMVVIELNDSAEVYASVDSAGGQEFALTGPVDVDIASTADIEFNDSASFTRSTDTGVNVEQNMDLFAFANVSFAREASSITSGSRWTHHGEFTVNGAEQTGVGFHGNYNRGNQSTTDTHGSSNNQAAFFAATSGQDFGVSCQELAGTEGGAGDIETQANWVGFGLINLDSLQGSSDTEVSANTDALTLTEQAASVSLDVGVGATVAALALATSAASISVATDVQAAVDALSLTENQASISYDVGVSAGVDSLALTENQASIAHDINVNGAIATLTLTENQATISLGVDVQAATDALTLTEQQASIANDVNVAGAVDALILTEFQATVDITSDTNVNANFATLTLTEFAADRAFDVGISPVTVDLTTTTYAATLSADTIVNASADALTLTEFAAGIAFDVSVSTGVDALNLVEYAATVLQAPRVYLNTSQTLTGATELTVTSYAVDGTSVTFDDAAGAPTGSLFLGVQNTRNAQVGWIAVTVTGGDTNVSASVDALALTEQAAAVALDVDVQASTDALSLATYSASIVYDVEVSAALASLTLTELGASATLAPRVYLNSSQTLSGATELTVTAYSLDGTTVTFDDDVGAPTGSQFLGVQNTRNGQVGWIGVTVTTGGTNVAANVDVLTLSEYQASITYDVEVFSAVDALSLTEQPAGIALDVDVQASTDALTLTTLQASLSADYIVSAGVAALSLTENASTVSYDVDVLAATDALTLATYQASLSEDTNVQASIASLSLVENPATVGLDLEISAGTASLVLAQHPTSFVYDVEVLTSVDALVVSAHSAAVLTGSVTRQTFEVPVRDRRFLSEARDKRFVVTQEDRRFEVGNRPRRSEMNKRPRRFTE